MNDSKKDFLYALLALDSYNRHEEGLLRNLSDKDGRQLSSEIGLIKFEESSDRFENDGIEALQGSQTSGFSASHYTLGDDTIIAFRGTDFPPDFSIDAVLEFFRDFSTGWLTSFNAIDSETFDPTDFEGDEISLQPYFARQFYEHATGNKVFPTLADGEQPNDVILTGHSLGGALAGFVGSLTGNQTTTFNELPFLGLALTSAINNFINQNLENGVDAISQALTQALRNEEIQVEGFSFTPFVLPNPSSVESFRMTGEVAILAREFGSLLGTSVRLYVDQFVNRIENAVDAAAGVVEGDVAGSEADLTTLVRILSFAYEEFRNADQYGDSLLFPFLFCIVTTNNRSC